MKWKGQRALVRSTAFTGLPIVCHLAMSDRLLFSIAVALYGICSGYSLLLWRRGFREDNRWLSLLIGAGSLFHTGAMFQRGFRLDRCPIHNLFEATVFILWTVVIAYLVLAIFPRFRFVGAFASPLLFGTGIFALFPILDQPGPVPHFDHAWETLHAALILLAYGAFGLSAVAALMYLSQEHDLKFDKSRALFARLPSIQRLERVVSGLLLGGFILLTAGLLVGSWWLKTNRGYWINDDPKVVWSLFVWAAYLILVLLRAANGAHGRRYAWGVIGTFTFVFLTFWGTNVPSAIHHP